jgi:hypothetical protein
MQGLPGWTGKPVVRSVLAVGNLFPELPLMTAITLGRLTCLGLLLSVAATAGCSKAEGTAANPNAGKTPPAKTNSIWEPDPGWANELTQTITFDKYQLSAPKYLKADKTGVPAGAMTIYSWKIDSGMDVPATVLTVAVTSDKKMVAEAQKDMRKSVFGFTGGMTKQWGLQYNPPSAPETGSLGGIPFTRIKWHANSQTIAADGLSYGAIDGDNAVMIVAASLGQDSITRTTLMQAVIATFKKQ